MCAPKVCVGILKLYSSVQMCTQYTVHMSTVYQYMNIYKVRFPCVCPIYFSCVHRSTVHLYKLCTIWYYICTIHESIYLKCPCVYWSNELSFSHRWDVIEWCKMTWGKKIIAKNKFDLKNLWGWKKKGRQNFIFKP